MSSFLLLVVRIPSELQLALGKLATSRVTPFFGRLLDSGLIVEFLVVVFSAWCYGRHDASWEACLFDAAWLDFFRP